MPRIPTNPPERAGFTSSARKRIGLEQRPLGAPAVSVSGYDLSHAILEGDPYPIKALLSFGGNLITQHPGSQRMAKALTTLGFHVHFDMVHTPMSHFADLVLPVAQAWESPGLHVGFLGALDAVGHIQYRSPAVAPPGEARPDLRIIMDLAVAMGYGDHFWQGDIQTAFNHRLEPCGITLADLERHPEGITVPVEIRYRKYAEETAGRVRGFATPTGKLEIYSERLLEHGFSPLPLYQPPMTAPLYRPATEFKEFPLILSSFKLRSFCQSQHRGVARLRKVNPHPFAEVHPETAAAFGLAERDWVALESPQGAIKVMLHIRSHVPPGTVYAQAGWWEGCDELGLPGYDPFSSEGANLNRLIDSHELDPLSGGAPLKSYRCRITHWQSFVSGEGCVGCDSIT